MLFTILAGQNITAQVANYGFVSTTQSYTPLATFTSVNATGGVFGGSSDDGYLQVTLPFTFTYNGSPFTVVTMSTNGWLAMGASVQVNANARDGSNMFNNTNPNNIVGGYFRDGNANFGSGGSLRHGSGGTDIYVLEWNQVSGNGFNTSATVTLSYQISLYGPASSAPGRIEISFGPSASGVSTSAAIGIHGTGSDYINALTGTSNSTTLSSAFPAANTLYRFSVPVPCVAPTAQPTALTFGTTTTTAIAGSFTAASPAPSKYMVVRSTSATPPTAPTNGTAYANGSAALGTGTSVVQSSTALSFNDTGLAAGTTYYYYIYSFNDGCSGAPNYLTASPLTASKTTVCATGTSVSSNTITSSGANITWSGSGNYIVE